MKNLMKSISALGLLLTVVPSFLVLDGHIAWNLHAQLMFAGMVLWFVSAPFWMKAGS